MLYKDSRDSSTGFDYQGNKIQKELNQLAKVRSKYSHHSPAQGTYLKSFFKIPS